MKNLHTPGNWTIKEPTTRTFKERTEVWVDGDKEMIFEVLHNEKSLKETAANAKLIVAAPELLKALEEINDIATDVALSENGKVDITKILRLSSRAIEKVIK